MRRWLFIGLAVPVLLAGGHTAFWRWSVVRADAALQDWAEARRGQGWRVEWAGLRNGGWPLAASVSLADLHITAKLADVPGTVSFSAGQASATVGLLDPRHVVLQFGGAMAVQAGDGPAVPFTADLLRIGLPLTAGAPPSEADALAERLQVSPADPAQTVTVEHVHVVAAWHPAAGKGDPAVGLKIQAGPIVLPAAPPPGMPAQIWALGNRIDRLDLLVTMGGPLPHAPTPAAWITQWRDGGGSARLDLTALSWGQLGASGTATMSFDGALQPAGTAMLRVSGIGETLDALAAARVMPARTASTAKAVLSLMARPQPGGPPVVEAPLTVQDRTLQFGRIPLARMPELQWSGAP